METLSRERRSYLALNTRPDIDRSTAMTLVGCCALAAAGGAGAAIVAIIALARGPIRPLDSVAALALGGALLLHGMGIAARAKRRYHEAADGVQEMSLLAGLALEVIGGAAGIVLALTALAGILPDTLVPVAMIVLGGAAVVVAPAQYTVAWLAPHPERALHRAALSTSTSSAWALVLAGMAAVVLGILPLLGLGDALVLSGAAAIALGFAVFLAAGGLALRFAVQRDAYPARVPEQDAARMIELMSARLAASRTGYKLYVAVIGKLRARHEPRHELLIRRLETSAAKEVENREYLEAQIYGLGGDVNAPTSLAELESRTTHGSEEIIADSSVTDPLQLLYALHAADTSDAAGWHMLMQVVDEIGHHEMKKEVTVRYLDKAEQVRLIGLIVEQLTRRTFVAEKIDTPPIAYS